MPQSTRQVLQVWQYAVESLLLELRHDLDRQRHLLRAADGSELLALHEHLLAWFAEDVSLEERDESDDGFG